MTGEREEFYDRQYQKQQINLIIKEQKLVVYQLQGDDRYECAGGQFRKSGIFYRQTKKEKEMGMTEDELKVVGK